MEEDEGGLTRSAFEKGVGFSGHIIDIETNATSKFYRRRGVYFMKIYVPKDKLPESGFVRPGAA